MVNDKIIRAGCPRSGCRQKIGQSGIACAFCYQLIPGSIREDLENWNDDRGTVQWTAAAVAAVRSLRATIKFCANMPVKGKHLGQVRAAIAEKRYK